MNLEIKQLTLQDMHCLSILCILFFVTIIILLRKQYKKYQEFKKLSLKMNELDRIIESHMSELNKKKAYITSCETENTNLKQQYQMMEKNFLLLSETKSKMTNELKNQMNDLYEQLKESNLKMQDLQSDKDELEKIKQEYINLNQERQKQKVKLEDIKKQIENGYDMIIHMTSLFDLQNSGKGLKMQKINSSFNSDQNDFIIVGFLGTRNKGKTFLLNSLINENFASGFHLSTPGLCLKEHKVQNKKVVYIDSEGVGNPISMDYLNNKHYSQFIQTKRNYSQHDEDSQIKLENDVKTTHYDIKATEQIQQEIIIQNSNILIVVISQLTLEDQKLLHTISEKFFANNKKSQKKLIVVHNLKEFYQIEAVNNYIKSLNNNFTINSLVVDCYEQQNGEPYFNKIFYDEFKNDINHVVFANQNSEAGRYYNKFALSYIKQQISTYQGLVNFNVQEKIKEYLNKNLTNYVNVKNEQPDHVKQSQILLDFVECIEEDKEGKKEVKIMLKQGYTIESIRELQVDIYGSLQKDCNYSIVNSKDKKDETHIFIEIPGTAVFQRRFDKQNGIFQIKIQQNKNLEDKEGEIIASTRKFEERTFNIPICREKELWNYLKDNDKKFDNGIVKFHFKKEENVDYE